MEEDESESNVELHEKMLANGRGLNPRTLGLTANSQRAFEAEREYKVRRISGSVTVARITTLSMWTFCIATLSIGSFSTMTLRKMILCEY